MTARFIDVGSGIGQVRYSCYTHTHTPKQLVINTLTQACIHVGCTVTGLEIDEQRWLSSVNLCRAFNCLLIEVHVFSVCCVFSRYTAIINSEIH